LLVNFFIAGIQKGGTTALHALLRCHHQISMAADKEPHFFDHDDRDWGLPDYQTYHDLFRPNSATAKIFGEATPIYSYWPRSIERIKSYNPSAKFIICLRHPAFRAHSHWRMEFMRGRETLSFHDAIRDAGRARVRAAPDSVHRVYSYVERGFYSWQIERLLSHFPRRHVHFIRTDHLWRDADRILTDIHRFLGVAQLPIDNSRRYLIPIDTREIGSLDDADRRYLTNLFREDILHAAELSGIDLTDWLNFSYEEPMTP
jgi:hypothetical protein